MSRSMQKVGVYVDSVNIAMNGGRGMRYDILREFAARDGAEIMRLNAYIAHDEERAKRDPDYKRRQASFATALRSYGFKVIQKKVVWYFDDEGGRVGKANADLDLAVDALLQSDNLDRVVMATGDGDFAKVVQALQNKGRRVEVVAFKNVSRMLRAEADLFMSGYLIPGLSPVDNSKAEWCQPGSRVRGVCTRMMDEGYGFFRILSSLSDNLWITDTRQPNSPYISAFFLGSRLPSGIRFEDMPSPDHVFEFTLTQVEGKEGFQAEDLELITRL